MIRDFCKTIKLKKLKMVSLFFIFYIATTTHCNFKNSEKLTHFNRHSSSVKVIFRAFFNNSQSSKTNKSVTYSQEKSLSEQQYQSVLMAVLFEH